MTASKFGPPNTVKISGQRCLMRRASARVARFCSNKRGEADDVVGAPIHLGHAAVEERLDKRLDRLQLLAHRRVEPRLVVIGLVGGHQRAESAFGKQLLAGEIGGRLNDQPAVAGVAEHLGERDIQIKDIAGNALLPQTALEQAKGERGIVDRRERHADQSDLIALAIALSARRAGTPASTGAAGRPAARCAATAAAIGCPVRSSRYRNSPAVLSSKKKYSPAAVIRRSMLPYSSFSSRTSRIACRSTAAGRRCAAQGAVASSSRWSMQPGILDREFGGEDLVADHGDADIAHSLDQPLKDHRRKAQRIEMDEVVRREAPRRQPDQPTLVERLVDHLAAMARRKMPSPRPGSLVINVSGIGSPMRCIAAN